MCSVSAVCLIFWKKGRRRKIQKEFTYCDNICTFKARSQSNFEFDSYTLYAIIDVKFYVCKVLLGKTNYFSLKIYIEFQRTS